MRAPRPSLVDDDVAGGDGRARVRGRGHHGRAHRALHAAALVLDEERPEVELDLRVGVRRSATEECRGLLHPTFRASPSDDAQSIRATANETRQQAGVAAQCGNKVAANECPVALCGAQTCECCCCPG
jgi:hypothetical protein